MIEIVEDTFSPLMAGIITRLHRPLPQHVVDEMAAVFRSMEQAQFMSAGSYGGPAWPGLAETTLRKKKGASAQLLVEEGTLWESLTVPDAPFSVAESTDQGAELGTSDPVAVYHQYGTQRMPRREVIPNPVPNADQEQFAEILGDWIVPEDGGDDEGSTTILGALENILTLPLEGLADILEVL